MRKEQVKKILLTPIVTDKYINGIFIKNNVIYSGQKYYSSDDCDMSDFAVGFYKIIYKNNLLKKELLNDKNKLNDLSIAGDTMNTYIKIAKLDKKNLLTDYLKEYYFKYRSLANFWLIPYLFGRKGKKLNGYDSISMFLELLECDYNEILKSHETYTNEIPDYNEFLNAHFLNNFSSDNYLRLFKSKNRKELVLNINENIDARAEEIS